MILELPDDRQLSKYELILEEVNHGQILIVNRIKWSHQISIFLNIVSAYEAWSDTFTQILLQFV